MKFSHMALVFEKNSQRRQKYGQQNVYESCSALPHDDEINFNSESYQSKYTQTNHRSTPTLKKFLLKFPDSEDTFTDDSILKAFDSTISRVLKPHPECAHAVSLPLNFGYVAIQLYLGCQQLKIENIDGRMCNFNDVLLYK